MIKQFEELEERLSKLPTAEQELWVSHFLEELQSTTVGKDIANESTEMWIGGQKPSTIDIAEAIENLTKLSKSNRLGHNLSLKEMINEGRHR
jgi:hypothetical protein